MRDRCFSRALQPEVVRVAGTCNERRKKPSMGMMILKIFDEFCDLRIFVGPKARISDSTTDTLKTGNYAMCCSPVPDHHRMTKAFWGSHVFS